MLNSNKKVKCTKCGEEKLTTEFYKRSDRKTGHTSRCKPCRDNWRAEDRKKRPKKWSKMYVKHDHVSGQVRGLLCTRCNPGLGYFEDSIEKLEMAIRYLRKFEK